MLIYWRHLMLKHDARFVWFDCYIWRQILQWNSHVPAQYIVQVHKYLLVMVKSQFSVHLPNLTLHFQYATFDKMYRQAKLTALVFLVEN